MLSDIRFYHGFNPHTHEGCDFMLGKMPIGKAVSIHTPTKGVTNIAAKIAVIYVVSIHTPTKGVTTQSLSVLITFG